ncbi:F0F1 ATP synthase subunit B family protein [Tsuneonella sp. HG222]
MLDILAHAAEAEHAAPGAFGIEALGPGFFVATAMLVVIGIMLWKGVPGLVAGMLDQKIAGIRQQLDEAKALRAEAERLRDEYAKKTAEAEQDIAALRAGAERQAEEIVAKAKDDATALIARHKALAADKIASAERAAIEEVRAKVASAAAVASRQLIAAKHGEADDRALADKIIAGI